MNCWGIRIYFTKSRFSLNGGLFVYMELLLGHEKIITKCGNIKLGFYCLFIFSSTGFFLRFQSIAQSAGKSKNVMKIL
jgi:hypothetical protein